MLYKKLSHNPHQRTFDTPSWTYWDNVFTSQELNFIIEKFSKADLRDSVVSSSDSGYSVNRDIRRSKVNFLNFDDASSWVFERFNGIIENINETFYNFELNGYWNIQYSEYHAQDSGEYNFHMDFGFGNSSGVTGIRKLSLAMLLNDEFEGGEFQINLGSEKNAETIETRKNRAILFPSFLIHRVAPVTWGVRKSLVIWVIGPKFR